MAKISIDFGTSFSTAAYLDQSSGKPQAIIFNENGDVKLPTVAYISPDGHVEVGQAVFDAASDANAMSEEDRNMILSSIIFSIKSKLQPDGVVYYRNGKVTHEEIVAAVFRKIKSEAETVCNFSTPLSEVTVTHPVVFEQWKKDILVNAARKAGFATVNLLEEPIAAAVGYLKCAGIDSKGILVYDFGGGTFDVAYVRKGRDNKYQIPIQPLGEPNCGGDDIDRLIYNKFNDLSRSLYSIPLSKNVALADICFLLRCRKNKEKLSRSSLPVKCNEIHPLDVSKRLNLQFTPQEFDELISPIIDRTIAKTKALLNEIKRLGYPLEHAILIGGSSRLPLVSKKLVEILPVRPQPVMQTDVAVALGGIYDETIYDESVKIKKYIFCIYCGAKNDSKGIYCANCGHKLYKHF